MDVMAYWLIAYGVMVAREGRGREFRVAVFWPYYLGKALADRYLP